MRKVSGICTVDGCDGGGWSRGWCQKHYFRWRRTGSTETTFNSRPIAERFALCNRVLSNGCWEWTAHTSPQGYGRISDGGIPKYAHRVAYELHVGPIPEGLDIDHQCHNRDVSCTAALDCPHRRCVNPEHLAPATRQQNIAGQHRTRGRASA